MKLTIVKQISWTLDTLSFSFGDRPGRSLSVAATKGSRPESRKKSMQPADLMQPFLSPC